MTKVDVTSKLTTCSVCHKSYFADEDVCNCPEEPVVKDWEDNRAGADGEGDCV
jgi:hypothetical protein